MPSIHYMNAPPHPFWDFVREMNDHPFFGGQAQQQPQGEAGPSNTRTNPEATAEDPPEVDPATVHPGGREHPFQNRHARREERAERREERREARRCGGRMRGGGWGHWGPPAGPPFAFGPRSFFGPPGFDDPRHEMHGRGGHGFRGRGGFHGYRGPSPPHHGHHHGHHHGPPGPPFDLGAFLNRLGERIGVDLNGAAENLGLDHFIPTGPSHPDVDFEPRVDIFDLPGTPGQYIVHVSLPGAKKSDVGVDWDGERSVLRVAGVVHRPEVNEEMLAHLIVDGRRREVGVFEKDIRLGTRREPAHIDVSGIKARMADGVLIVTVPKVEAEKGKRDVPVAEKTPSPVRGQGDRQGPLMFFDADEEMYDAPPRAPLNEKSIPISTAQVYEEAPVAAEEPKSSKEKEAAAEKKAAEAQQSRESSHTIDAEADDQNEPLPAYQPSADSHHSGEEWETFDSDGEGDYVKINVD